MSKHTRLLAAALLSSALAVSLVAANVQQAGAASLPSDCPANVYVGGLPLRLCLYYAGNGTGAEFKENHEARPDYAGLHFDNSGSGSGTLVKNNAASAANPTISTADIFYNEHCSGPYDVIASKTLKNLVNTWNDEASYENPFLGDGTRGGC